MSSWSVRRLALRHLAPVLLAGGLGVLGCGQPSKPAPDESEKPASTSASTSESKQSATSTQTARSTEPPGPAPVQPSATPVRDRLHQSFAEAVRGPDNPPPNDAERPPDETVTKKPTGRIFEVVRNSWDRIRFTTAAGKKIRYTAQVDTSVGQMVIELYPEQAPNHVRNFVALAKAGYYDQLFFDTIRHEENPMTKQQLHTVEAGCPLGKGGTRTSYSIGYWLKAEFTTPQQMTHEEGTVAACRGEEDDSAATRFYITLDKAPFLDGNYTIFGKVVRGLDVLRKMGQTPVILDEEGNSRPQTPIVIHKVTVVEKEG